MADKTGLLCVSRKPTQWKDHVHFCRHVPTACVSKYLPVSPEEMRGSGRLSPLQILVYEGKRQTTPQSQHRGTIKTEFTVGRTCSWARLTVSILIISQAFGGLTSAHRRAVAAAGVDLKQCEFLLHVVNQSSVLGTWLLLFLCVRALSIHWVGTGWSPPAPEGRSEDRRHPESGDRETRTQCLAVGGRHRGKFTVRTRPPSSGTGRAGSDLRLRIYEWAGAEDLPFLGSTRLILGGDGCCPALRPAQHAAFSAVSTGQRWGRGGETAGQRGRWQCIFFWTSEFYHLYFECLPKYPS